MFREPTNRRHERSAIKANRERIAVAIVACCMIRAYEGWLRFVGSLKTYVSLAKEPYSRDFITQKRPMFIGSLLT